MNVPWQSAFCTADAAHCDAVAWLPRLMDWAEHSRLECDNRAAAVVADEPQAVAQPVAAAAVQVPQAAVAPHVLADGLSLASQSASDPVEQVTAPAAPEPQLPSLQ